MLNSLRARLIVSYVVVVLLTLCIAGVGLLVLLQDFQRGILTQRLGDALGPAAVQARDALRNNTPVAAVANEVQQQIDPAWRVLVIDEQGEIVADSKRELIGRRLRPVIVAQSLRQARVATGQQNVGGLNLVFAAAPVGRPNDTRLFLLLAAVLRPLEVVDEVVRSLLTAAVIALAAAILLAFLLARSISEPLGQLSRATEAIARGQYEQPIPVRGNDEVSRLAANFNGMTRAVQRSQQVQKDFLANVSHELRTPLTSIQGFSQAIMEGATRDLDSARHAAKLIYEESLRMARLVADLMTLARFDAGDIPLEHKPLDLAAMLPAWVERFKARANQQAVTLTLTLDAPPPIIGDAGRLEQAVSNLIDNAIKYNRAGGRVEVQVARAALDRAGRAAKAAPKTYALIQVRDTGQGIPAAAQARLFERFYRADPARVAGGAGLGLSIVQEIVKAHHGEIQFESQEGVGTTFKVWLPSP